MVLYPGAVPDCRNSTHITYLKITVKPRLGLYLSPCLRVTGKYDAFETVMEILRMKVRYPNALPFEFADLDPEFESFMRCGRAIDGQKIQPQAQHADPLTPSALCGHSEYDPPLASCKVCNLQIGKSGLSKSHGVPGGAVCCRFYNTSGLASCPRLWQ